MYPINSARKLTDRSHISIRARSLVQADNKLEMGDSDEAINDLVTETYHRVTNSFVYVFPNTPLVLDHVVSPAENTAENSEMHTMDVTTMSIDKVDGSNIALMANTTELASVMVTTMVATVETSMMPDEITPVPNTPEMLTTPDDIPKTMVVVDSDSLTKETTITPLMEPHTTGIDNVIETIPPTMQSMSDLDPMVPGPIKDTIMETVTMENAMASMETTTQTTMLELANSIESTVEVSSMPTIGLETTTLRQNQLSTLSSTDSSIESTFEITPKPDLETTSMMMSNIITTTTITDSEHLPTITATSVPLTSMSAIINQSPIRPNGQESILAMDETETEMSLTMTTMKTSAQSQTGTKKPGRGSSVVHRPSMISVVSTMMVGIVGWIML